MGNRGVTLIEVLVVATLIGLVAAVAAPSVGSGVETVKLRSSAERLAATFRLARERAVRSRHYWQVSVDAKTGRVELRDLEGQYARDWELSAIADQQISLQFPPDGSVPAGKVVLRNSRGRTATVETDPFTAFAAVTESVQ